MLRRLLPWLIVVTTAVTVAALALSGGSTADAEDPTPTPTPKPSMEKDADVLEEGIQTGNTLWIMNGGCSAADKGEGCLLIEKWVLEAYDPEGVGTWSEQIHFDPAVVEVTPEFDETWLESTGRSAGCSYSVISDGLIESLCLTTGTAYGPSGSGLIENIHVLPLIDDLIGVGTGLWPHKDNGIVTSIMDTQCKLGDIYGEDIPGTLPGGLTEVCGDVAYNPIEDEGGILVRILPADFNLNCSVSVSDVQGVWGRWGVDEMYDDWYDVKGLPQAPDGLIDVADAQFAWGRWATTCDHPDPYLQQSLGGSQEGDNTLPGGVPLASLAEGDTVVRIDPASQYVPGLGEQFTVDVLVDDVSNLGAYEFTLEFDPDVITFVDVSDSGFLGSSGRSMDCLGPIVDDGTVRFACATVGSDEGPSGSGQLAQLTFESADLGTSPLNFARLVVVDPLAEYITASAENGSVTVADSDGDGCSDGQEAAMGFDPNAWYDFYDVPVPTAFDGGTLDDRDRAVSILYDGLAVLEYAGTSDGGACNSGPDGIPGNADDRCYNQDNNGDTLADGELYDRTASPEPSPPWDAGPPDGAISILEDVMVVIAQTGLSCQGSP